MKENEENKNGVEKTEKKKFISLGYLSKKMLIPLLIPFFYCLRHYVLEQLDKELQESNINEKRQSVFINTFLISVTYSLDILLFLIENKNSKSKTKVTQEKKFDNQLIIERIKIEKKQKTYTWIYLFLLSIFNFFNYLFYDIIGMFKPPEYNKNFFYSLSIPIFFIITALMSYLFLNYKIYLHQKVAMIISPFFSLSLLVIIRLLGTNEKNNNTLYSVFFLIECLGLRSLRYVLVVLGKLFMEKMFVTQFKLMAFMGIFGILFSIITNLISYLINVSFIENPSLNDYFIIKENGTKILKNIFNGWGEFTTEKCLLLILTVLVWWAENNIMWYSIYELSPNHYTVYASISSIIILFIELVIKEFDIHTIFISVFTSVSLCGIFICGLIFNEIIIIRICGMDKYTNVEINKRQKLETINSLTKFNCELPETSFDNDSIDGRISRSSSTLF